MPETCTWTAHQLDCRSLRPSGKHHAISAEQYGVLPPYAMHACILGVDPGYMAISFAYCSGVEYKQGGCQVGQHITCSML